MGCGGWLATVIVAMALSLYEGGFLWEKNNPFGRRGLMIQYNTIQLKKLG